MVISQRWTSPIQFMAYALLHVDHRPWPVHSSLSTQTTREARLKNKLSPPSSPVKLALPVPDMVRDKLRRLFGGEIASDGFDKVSFWICARSVSMRSYFSDKGLINGGGDGHGHVDVDKGSHP